MGTCVICGTPVDGRVCSLHEEDVAWEFRGDRPEQLGTGRYYRGTVDGFADFGVFVDIGDQVTGLLHQSEVEGRLESLDWEPGDTAYVQVTAVHDNGNVDLGWSIRQSEREFRGSLVHDPGADEPERTVEEVEEGNANAGAGGAAERADQPEREAAPDSEPAERSEHGEVAGAEPDAEAQSGSEPGPAVESESESTSEPEAETASESETESESESEPERVAVEALGDSEGERVRIEGRIEVARQTGGPTIFEVADGSGRVDCAAFESPGERAYPEIGEGDVVAVVGEVERRRGELQVESESVVALEGEKREQALARLEAAVEDEARPPETDPLVDDPALEGVHEAVVEAATAVRRAVVEERPVVVRHRASVDGYVAGAAVERAVLGLIRSVHDQSGAEYHYLSRRPLDDPFYGMGAATDDVTSMLGDAARHDEKRPLVLLAGTGSTRESEVGLELLEAYDVDRVVVDANPAADDVSEAATVSCVATERTAGVVGAHLAAVVNPDVRAELGHLPAVSYWEPAPEAYRDLAAEAGYDTGAVADLREAVALEAFYQTYEGKRELIRDLFWTAEHRELAAYLADQFREKLDDELAAAGPHVEREERDGVAVVTLDAAAFTHRFEFPPTGLLLDAIHRRERREREGEGPQVAVGVGEDDLRVRCTEPLDVRAVAEAVSEQLPSASVRSQGAREGRIEYLRGERDAVVEAVVEAAVDRVAAPARSPAPGNED